MAIYNYENGRPYLINNSICYLLPWYTAFGPTDLKQINKILHSKHHRHLAKLCNVHILETLDEISINSPFLKYSKWKVLWYKLKKKIF